MKKNEDKFLEGLKAIAKKSIESHDTMLIHWWCKKYNLPPNHPLLLDRYEEDLLLEVLQDNLIREKETRKDSPPEVSEEEFESLLTQEHEKQIKRKLSKYNKNNKLNKWQEKARFISGEDDVDDLEDDEFEDEF